MLLALAMALAGAALSHFKALILIPAVFLVGGFVVAIKIENSQSFRSIAVAFFVAAVNLQAGYLAGVVARFWTNPSNEAQRGMQIARLKRLLFGPF
jgi:hypothetical protein